MSKKPDLDDAGQLFHEELSDMSGGRPIASPSGCAAEDFPRWAELGLDDPLRDGGIPIDGQTADVLLWALGIRGADDPVASIFRAVSTDLHSLAHLLESSARRVDAGLLLLARADGRAPTPATDDPDAPTAPPSRRNVDPAGA